MRRLSRLQRNIAPLLPAEALASQEVLHVEGGIVGQAKPVHGKLDPRGLFVTRVQVQGDDDRVGSIRRGLGVAQNLVVLGCVEVEVLIALQRGIATADAR